MAKTNKVDKRMAESMSCFWNIRYTFERVALHRRKGLHEGQHVYLAMNNSVSSFLLNFCCVHGNSDDVAAWASKNVIHSPFDLSNGIEHARFLKNRIRQSDDGFRHFDCVIRQNLTV